MQIRVWLFPVSSAFAVGALATLAAFGFGHGCEARCFNSFDCGPGSHCNLNIGICETECFTDLDCRLPASCQDNPSACPPLGLRCNGVGKCVGTFELERTGATRPAPIDPAPTQIDGFDRPPGDGRSFVVRSFSIAGEGRGFDLDGKCDSAGRCVDNILAPLGEFGNDQIRQGLLGGESLLLIELSGLAEPFRGDDRSLTLKLYGARDADNPLFPANNFSVPLGQTTCCEFKISPQSLSGPPAQAVARAPARIDKGRLVSLAPVPLQFTLTVGVPPHPEIRLEHVLVSARVSSALDELSEGLLGGVLPVNTLAQLQNPYCKTISPRCTVQFTDSTLIDLISALIRPTPDIDLDIPADGLECVLDTDGDGRVDRCCDGAGLESCRTSADQCRTDPPIPPIDQRPGQEGSCALNPKLADGYSVGILFDAVTAKIVGVGQ